jgi:hypothetical protein
MWTMSVPARGFFEPDELAQVEVLFRALVPSDKSRGVPGAEEAGAANMLSRLLAMGPATYVEIPAWGALYRQGLPLLDAVAQELYGSALVDVDPESVTDLLARLERAELPRFPADFDQSLLFKTLWRHCLQGCFSDPRWGGNRAGIMWRWIGYLQPPEEL